ncbi:hypothetical protein [Fictibacillus terranigra]|uniref:DUF262 domain-containing protein n=1 Tax=Fictibacillus terranigra TaxID=3058424 RepID=A0ABT8E7L1_9BACL|nr:hypothetical protein [Fictibacillus sp. CENA-BCM004]MDN4073869.1 hypothetical protein [Fictibacillus sp. CENA-BCM004]
MILIFNDSHPEIKYDIFMRLNSGSVRLNEQELRNCLYRGNLNDALKEMAKNPKFLAILGLKYPHKRMVDCEMILRYFAFSHNYDTKTGKLKNYKGATKPFLNAFFATNQDLPLKQIAQLKQKFDNVISSVYEVFGDKAFRKLSDEEGFDSKLNKAIMDVIMISFEHYTFEEIKAKKVEIFDMYKRKLEEPKFNIAITQATSDTKVIEYRLNEWIEELNKVMMV